MEASVQLDDYAYLIGLFLFNTNEQICFIMVAFLSLVSYNRKILFWCMFSCYNVVIMQK